MGPGDPKNIANGIWNSILSWTFPPSGDYITQPQDMGSGPRSVFHTFGYSAGQRRLFLITLCKPAAAGIQGETDWNDAILRLVQHGAPVYGILAAGRRVAFFKYDGAVRRMAPWWPRPNAGREFYYIGGEDDLIQAALNDILDDH